MRKFEHTNDIVQIGKKCFIKTSPNSEKSLCCI